MESIVDFHSFIDNYRFDIFGAKTFVWLIFRILISV